MPDAMQKEGPVALVVQRRVAEPSYATYAHWQARAVARLQGWPGFVGHELIPPSPPDNMDWSIIQRFSSADAARAWLTSPDRAGLMEEIRPHLLAEEEVHLLPDSGPRPQSGATAFISYQVAPEDEAEFLNWQQTIYQTETRAPGFLRHKMERPVPGVRDDWIIILTFDTAENLTRWLESPERAALLKQAERIRAECSLRRTTYGFDFWFRDGDEKLSRRQIHKNNLLVLLVLYPIVFLWGYLVSAPFIDSRGVPFWLSLFIGNLVSTQLLGWWVAPAVFRAFSWWMAPAPTLRRELLGYGVIAALYALSMGGAALLLSLK